MVTVAEINKESRLTRTGSEKTNARLNEKNPVAEIATLLKRRPNGIPTKQDRIERLSTSRVVTFSKSPLAAPRDISMFSSYRRSFTL